jgi:methionyl-tRNA formyltransferase
VRIVYLANNRLGVRVLRWLVAEGEEVVGLGLHPPQKRVMGAEMLATAALPADRVLTGESIRTGECTERVCAMDPDIIVSVLFGYVLPAEILGIPRHGCVNLHPAYLPYNRGAFPNVWCIVDGTPAGVTLHYMDRGIDTGRIIAQEQVPVSPCDTGEALYRKLELAGMSLFKTAWPAIRLGRVSCVAQQHCHGTSHRVQDVEKIDRIDLDATYTGRHLIDLLRARTFPPHKGAYFEAEGRRIYIRVDLQYEEDLQG